METFVPIAAALVTTLGTIGGVYYTAKRYGKLGIAPAQAQLQSTLEKTVTALSAETATLRRQLDDAQAAILEEAQKRREMSAQFEECKKRLIRLESHVASLTVGEP